MCASVLVGFRVGLVAVDYFRAEVVAELAADCPALVVAVAEPLAESGEV
jgi:hypothetical protein